MPFHIFRLWAVAYLAFIFLCDYEAKGQINEVSNENALRKRRSSIQSLSMTADYTLLSNDKSAMNKNYLVRHSIWWSGRDRYRWEKENFGRSPVTREWVIFGLSHPSPVNSKYSAVKAFFQGPTIPCADYIETAEVPTPTSIDYCDPRFIGFSHTYLPGLVPFSDSHEVFAEHLDLRENYRITDVTINDMPCEKHEFVMTGVLKIGYEIYYSLKFDKEIVRIVCKDPKANYTSVCDIDYTFYTPSSLYFPSSINFVSTIENKVFDEWNCAISNVKINEPIPDSVFDLRQIGLPKGMPICTHHTMGQTKLLKLIDGRYQFVKPSGTPIQQDQSITPTINASPQRVAGDNPDRLYFIIAGCVLLVGAVAIAFLLLRRKQNPT